MGIQIELKTNLIDSSRAYLQAEDHMLKAGGKIFLQKRQDLRNEYCKLKQALTPDQTNAILKQLSHLSESVKKEAAGRLSEWDAKRRDKKITLISGSLSVAEFSKHFVNFYNNDASVLDSKEWKSFCLARDTARSLFVQTYQQGVSAQDVKEILQGENFSPEFIGRAIEEWHWKATSPTNVPLSIKQIASHFFSMCTHLFFSLIEKVRSFALSMIYPIGNRS
jgi:hypothetical protein